MTPFLGQRLRAERGFERLYSRHAADVYRYSLALLRNPADAEDVTQTTFLNAYRAYRNGERPAAPRAWLIAIAHNVCRQRFRTAQRRVEEVAYEDGLAEATVPDPEAHGAEDIRRALSHLAFNQRAALVMRELEGRSYAEIAEVLELSASAVETLLFRARRALREQLEGAYTCGEAERAISKQLDGRLSRAERSSLRAHLRACDECAALARRQRAQRSAVRSLGLIPLPSSLAAWGGGATTTGGVSAAAFGTGGGIALKAAAVLTAGTVAVGVGHEVAVRAPAKEAVASPRTAAVAPARRSVVPAARIAARPAAPAPAARAKVSVAAKSPRSARGSARSAAVRAATASRSQGRKAAGATGHARAKVARGNGAATSAAARDRVRARAAAQAKVKVKVKAKAPVKKPKPHARAAAKPKRKAASNGAGNGNGSGSGKDRGAVAAAVPESPSVPALDALPDVPGRG